ncbi:hypothetical protein B0I32_13192 [Nonomuraea fuscirosea]|uniref:Lipoprotein n=1 Tax=Nonomuraea fuscirosea TaxID=1291556 RepID=A0A2T0M5F1_9ACTN|nr:hypothetical protein [Nonomuraea fuscirosea]PRX52695.1 hypothetical protein B0I32_13192 [Nonomuraea fuscirosea]
MRRPSAVVALLVAVAGTTACTPDAPEATRPAPCPSDKACHAVIGTDPAIVVYRGEFYSNLMPLTARLEWLEEERCLVVTRQETDRQDRTLIPLWPEGTKPARAADGRRGVEIPQVGGVFEGTLIEAGGSNFPPVLKPPIPRISTFTEPPGACTAHDGYFVVDPYEVEPQEG